MPLIFGYDEKNIKKKQKKNVDTNNDQMQLWWKED